jgi:hypothetical protein
MCENGVALWKLSVRKKKTNNLSLVIRNLVLKWWAKEICINLNKTGVIRKKMKPNIFDEKSTHFLMETQVYLTSKFDDFDSCFESCNFYFF